MNPSASTPARYGRVAIGFHWLGFLLVALAYLAIEVRGPRGSSSRTLWMNTHVWAGTLLWLLSILRLGWRLWHGAPKPVPGPRLMTVLSQLVHVALYAFVLLQPLLGILIFNLGGKPVTLAGPDWSFTLVGPNRDLSHTVKAIHELTGNIFYGVIGVHAVAALWHHYFRRDGTLRRMGLGRSGAD